MLSTSVSVSAGKVLSTDSKRSTSAANLLTDVMVCATDSACATTRISSSSAKILRIPTRKIGSLSATITRISDSPCDMADESGWLVSLAGSRAIVDSPNQVRCSYLPDELVLVNHRCNFTAVSMRRAAYHATDAVH